MKKTYDDFIIWGNHKICLASGFGWSIDLIDYGQYRCGSLKTT